MNQLPDVVQFRSILVLLPTDDLITEKQNFVDELYLKLLTHYKIQYGHYTALV